jgi:ribosomal RNA assembly protein
MRLGESLTMANNIMHTRIPLERVGVLIGTSGQVKATVENKFHVRIEVEGGSGDISLTLDSGCADPVALFRARDTIMAIGRGFSPEKAFRLFSEEALLGVIDLRAVFGKSDSDISRVKGRLIGRGGKARRLIEELSGASICVYGHTVAIIGAQSQFDVAKEAIERLIRGDQHKSVYDYLQRKRSELRLKDAELWQDSNQLGKALKDHQESV